MRVRILALFLVGVMLAGLAPSGPSTDPVLVDVVRADDGHGSHDHGGNAHDYPHLDPNTPPPCRETRHEAGIGTICTDAELPAGLFAVLHADGSVGYTHGLDPAPPEPASADGGPSVAALAAPSRDPVCVNDGSSDYHMVAIYVRPTDRANDHATKADDIRTYIKRSNGLLNMEAEAREANADYRVACTSGVIDVLDITLSTTNAATTFNSIVSDIRAAGHDDAREKYWVWADVTSYGCSGIGHVYFDDSASDSNPNNGNAASMFAVTFGRPCSADNNVIVMMHENAHNQGAVQTSSPNSSGFASGAGGHCNDGDDIMCYADGGPDSNYDPNVCTARKFFDCNRDDYFNPRPAFGSYLDDHWNLGHTRNRFLFIELANKPPVMTTVGCTSAEHWAGEPITCQFRGTDPDPGDGIAYSIDWGDGQTERSPSSGFVASGTTRFVAHTFASAGAHTLQANATDDHPANPKRSANMTFVLTVHAANAKPTFTNPVSCVPSAPVVNDEVTCSWTATDSDASGLYYVVDFGDGSPTTRVPASGFVAPGAGQTAQHTFTSVGARTVSVTAYDDATPARSTTSGIVLNIISAEPCELDVSGNMLFGSTSIRSPSLNHRTIGDIAESCAGRGFLLQVKSGILAELDVCWLSVTGGELACTSGTSPTKAGTIPAGTESARLTLKRGIDVDYRLRVT